MLAFTILAGVILRNDQFGGRVKTRPPTLFARGRQLVTNTKAETCYLLADWIQG